MPEEKTILLVDDDISVRESMTSLLETFGYKVAAAASPQEALQMLDAAQGKFSLLLTDYNMKNEMNGIDLINAVRKRGLDDLPVILMSANAQEESLKRQFASVTGDKTLVLKPVDSHALNALIEEKIRKSPEITH